jgi:hypothetical protein
MLQKAQLASYTANTLGGRFVAESPFLQNVLAGVRAYRVWDSLGAEDHDASSPGRR